MSFVFKGAGLMLGGISCGVRCDLLEMLVRPVLGGPRTPEAASAANVEGSKGAENTFPHSLVGNDEETAC